MKATTLLGVLMLAVACALPQEKSPDIRKYVEMISAGQPEEAQHDLPALLEKYPGDPSVKYLQGMLATEGSEAVRIYQSIVDSYPRSEYADAALYKVYQFYGALKLNTTAELKLDQLKRDYPNSPYATGKAPGETKVVAIADPPHSTPVRTGSITIDTPAVKKPVAPPAAGGFALQVGAFSTQASASKVKAQMDELGYRTDVVPRDHGGKTLFLVWVGRYSSQEEARGEGQSLKSQQGISSMIVVR